MGTIWKFFLGKWLWQCKIEKLIMRHSSVPGTSSQWLNSIVVIPPIKNHFHKQWNQITQSLIYSVFVSICKLGANVTFKISKEIKNVAMSGLDKNLNKFYMCGFYLSLKSNREEWKTHETLSPSLAGKKPAISVWRRGPGISQKSSGKGVKGSKWNYTCYNDTFSPHYL